MVNLAKIGIIGWIVSAIFLIATVLPASGAEVRFLKVKFQRTQEELGQAIQNANRPQPEAGAQRSLGLAIVNSAQIVFLEKQIAGRVQEHLGKMILATSRPMPKAEVSPLAAQIRKGQIQKAMGTQIMTQARVVWAKDELAKTVQASFRSPRAQDGMLFERFNEPLFVLRSELGYGYQDNLRMGLTMLGSETGRPLGDFIPAPITVAPDPQPYLRVGTGGFWQFGMPALAGFAGLIGIFSWMMVHINSLPRGVERGPSQTRLPKAA